MPSRHFKLNVKSRILVKLFMKLLPGYAVFFSALILIGILYGFIANAMVGVIFLFICFVSLRYKYKDKITYHNESTKKCIALSIALFAISSLPLLVLNMRVSLIFCVSISIGMTWFLHEMGLKQKCEKELIELTKPKPFNVKCCTLDELLNRCRELGLKTNQVDFCVDAFVNRLTIQELADKYCLEIQSVKNKKQTYKNKLMKY